jgi:hypothetical protein
VVLKFDRRVLLVCQTRSGGTWRGGGSTSMNTLCEATDAPEVASIVALAHQGDGSSIRARFNAELEEACLETSMPVHPRSARATQATTIAPPRDQSTAGVREVSTPGTPPRAGRGILASLAAAVRPRSQATDEGAVTDLRKRLAGMREASGNRAVEIPTRAPSPTPIPTPAPTPAPRRSSSQTEFIA